MRITKKKVAKSVEGEYASQAAASNDAELLAWHTRVLEELRDAERRQSEGRDLHRQLKESRKQAHDTTTMQSVQPAATETNFEEKQEQQIATETDPTQPDRLPQPQQQPETEDERLDLSARRLEVWRLQALSDLLAKLLRSRIPTAPTARTRAITTIENEACPFCEHSYTVRDGASSRCGPDGQLLQMRKCRCREMTPPCKNCPICKTNDAIMSGQGLAQAELCRESNCVICACECPAKGKWIEGDEDSRAKFRERTARRHKELSMLLHADWSSGGSFGTGAGNSIEAMLPRNMPSSLGRLPADIKDQLEAVTAAQILLQPPVDRTCRKRGRHKISKHDDDVEHVENHYHRCSHPHDECTSDCCSYTDVTVMHENDMDGNENHNHHHHRCSHPHDECTSDCCSWVMP